jgi:malonate transporter and related proteins
VNGVLVAFAVIGVLIGAGYFSARFGLVAVAQGPTLNRIAFYIFSPALLFSVLAKTSVDNLFSPVIVVILISSLATALIFILLSRIFFRRNLSDTTVGVAASIYLNSNNIGLPISLFVIGDLSYYAPLLMMQIILFLPILLGILEASKGKVTSVKKIILGTLLNPLIIASVLGFLVSLNHVVLPEVVIQPLTTMGAAAVPLLLFAYGISLRGQKVFHADGDRPVSITATVLKALVMPAIALVVGAAVFHLPPHQLFAAVILTSLPTAQNMYTYASVYKAEVFAVRDVVFTTTIVSLPLMFFIAAIMAA